MALTFFFLISNVYSFKAQRDATLILMAILFIIIKIYCGCYCFIWSAWKRRNLSGGM
jgi:hypothetical protein